MPKQQFSRRPRTQRGKFVSKMAAISLFEKAITPRKLPCPAFPPPINRNPMITKRVRGFFTVVTGTDTNINAGAIALDDATDYLGGTPENPRYRTMRIERVWIWGPLLAAGDTTTPTQEIFVNVLNYGPGPSGVVLALEDSSPAGETNRRPRVSWSFGGAMVYTIDTSASTTLCTILGASVPGVYTLDALVRFQ